MSGQCYWRAFKGSRRPAFVAAVLLSLVTACGGDDEMTDGDAAQADAIGSDTTPADAAVADVPQADAPSDAASGTDADTAADSASDAGGDTAANDVATDSGADTGPCVDAVMNCDGCRFDFSAADTGRPTVRVSRIAVTAGVMRVANATVVDSSPLASFSASWLNYIERVAPDWVASDDRTGFDSVGSTVPIPAGDFFEVEVEFGALDGGTGCVDDRNCGRVVIEVTACDGSARELGIPISH